MLIGFCKKPPRSWYMMEWNGTAETRGRGATPRGREPRLHRSFAQTWQVNAKHTWQDPRHVGFAPTCHVGEHFHAGSRNCHVSFCVHLSHSLGQICKCVNWFLQETPTNLVYDGTPSWQGSIHLPRRMERLRGKLVNLLISF